MRVLSKWDSGDSEWQHCLIDIKTLGIFRRKWRHMSYSFRVDEDGNIIWRVGVSGSLIGFREMRIDWEGNEKRARLERILAMRILMQK